MEDRKRTYMLFVDLKKGYDLVNRDLLLAKMWSSGLPKELVVVIAKMLAISSVKLKEVINTTQGVP